MKLKSITEVEPVESLCIEVSGDRKLFAVGEPGKQILSHNSVAQRNIINACIMRPENWRFLGIDLKRVELSSYRAFSNVVLGVATVLEDALTVLRFAQQTMMKRYNDLEQLGYNKFLDLPEAGQALLVMVDEATELLQVSGVKALAGSTLVKYADGSFRTLESLQPGDRVVDAEGEPTPVLNKYIPDEQQSYRLKITSDKTHVSQDVIAGYAHYWVFYNESSNGEISESDLTVTADIVGFVNDQAKLPPEEQTKVKFFRTGPDGDEWFTLDEVQEIEHDETLYCISVDSPTKQFLVTESCIPTHNTDEGKDEDQLKGEAAMAIGSIARLGRAAGVHLVIATQRPDATVISGETKQNLAVRIHCGRARNSTASQMILESSEGLRIAPNPPGRMYVDLNGTGNHGQGFFAGSDWIAEWLAEQGLNPDGTPISEQTSRLAKLVDMNEFDGADLDSREGVDNRSAIEKIRQEEEGESSEITSPEDDEEEDDFVIEDEPEDPSPTPESTQDSNDELERPQLIGKSDSSKFDRPEDDWDDDLEALIEENG